MTGPTRFGDSYPYMNIAKEYGVDYSDVLTIAHVELFPERPPGFGFSDYVEVANAMSDECFDDILAQVERSLELRIPAAT